MKNGDNKEARADEIRRRQKENGRARKEKVSVFHGPFGVRVEVLDYAAYERGRGEIKCRRLQDGEIIMVRVDELSPVRQSTEADRPRELFPHEAVRWHDLS